jgi:Flp pilus assembly protein TadG
MRKNERADRPMSRTGRDLLGIAGTTAVEFALTAPILIGVVAGIVDVGMLAARTAAVAGATRVGAEYARNNSVCKADIQATSCISGIKSAMQNTGNFSPALTFSSDPSPSCECDDNLTITCGTTCTGAGRPGPNRVLVTVTATQAFSPLISWPGIPTSLTKSTEIRIQ